MSSVSAVFSPRNIIYFICSKEYSFFSSNKIDRNAVLGECLPPDSRQCQPGMYSSAGTCLACHNSCKTCTGPKVRPVQQCWYLPSLPQQLQDMYNCTGPKVRPVQRRYLPSLPQQLQECTLRTQGKTCIAVPVPA